MKISVLSLLFPLALLAQEKRNLTTDEPLGLKGKSEGAAEYIAKADGTDGQHLALTMHKLEHGISPARPFLIWAIGSSYTNMLGNGEFWQEEIPKRFPNAPSIEYKKMVGNSCPWQYARGWLRHLVIPDQPDLIITYTLGDPADLEKLILEIRQHTTADIIVPSIHWRESDAAEWGKSENSPQQNVEQVREICRKYQVEFIESRRDWGAYLTANQLPISALLKDAVHQSDYGAKIINSNILAHFRHPDAFSYKPESRERRIPAPVMHDGSMKLTFTGSRIDLISKKSAAGGSARVLIDGQPADQLDAFLMSYVLPDEKNHKEGKGSVPRDQAPHAVTLGQKIIPQSWKIVMTSEEGDYELKGSITGPDGQGNAFKPFTSKSGQILIEPELWRRAERNGKGDLFTWDVRRAGVSEVSFKGEADEVFVTRLVQSLPNTEHTLELRVTGEVSVDAFDVFQPPVITAE
jgi:hypothetical protein